MPASSQSAILSQTCTFDAELCGQNTFKSGLKCWRGFINPYSLRTLITLIIYSYNVISQAAGILSPPRSSSFSRRVFFWTPTWLRVSFWNPNPLSSSAAKTCPAPWTSSSSSTCVDVPTMEIYAAAQPLHPFLCDFFCKRPFPTFHFPLFPTHCFENSCLLQRLPEACRNEVPRLFKASIPV